MAANKFGRYVWLVETLRHHGRLTFEEINRLWQQSGLSYGDGDELAIRTFHRHREAISDIFQIDILCEQTNGYYYYISNPEQLQRDSLRSWLIDSYSVMNQIQVDSRLEGRILFEEVPSGNVWLTSFTDAIRRNRVLMITHQGFGRSVPSAFEIEPYYLKVTKRRWYVVARSPYYDEFRVYALDRIFNAVDTGKSFEMRDDFDIDEFFKGCCGVIPSNGKTVEMIIKAYGTGADYLRTLPLHESQVELTEMEDDEACYFKYEVCPTFDLYQTLFAQADQIEVVSPLAIRQEMRDYAEKLMAYYNE